MNKQNTIIIIDDEQLQREILFNLLKDEGYHLIFAEDGVSGLEMIKKHNPDLILLDIMMPGLSGYDVCRTVRETPNLRDIPIIMLTSMSFRDARLEGIASGVDDFIPKPYDKTELKIRLKSILRLNRYRRMLIEKEKFDWVIQQSNDGYLMLNTEGEILYANSKAKSYLNLQTNNHEDVIDNFPELIKKQYRLLPETMLKSWPNVDTNFNSSFFLIRPETDISNEFWIEADILKLPSESDQGFVIRLQDITDTMNMQRMLWEFHSLISHKLNTPLSTVYGRIEIIKMIGRQISNDDIIEHSEEALASTNQLINEIKTILQFINAPKHIDTTEGYQLSNIQELFEQISNEHNVENITINFEDDILKEKIVISKNQAYLIFTELIKNSIKHHPNNKPSIELSFSKTDGSNILFDLKDDGVNLSPEQLEKIWVPYYQAEKSLTGQVDGMGLGLAFIANIIKEANGKAWAFNNQDKTGLTIRLIIPAI